MLKDGLGAALLSAALNHPDRPALWAADETLTYRALFERAGALASLIRNRGVPAGQRVAILSHRTASAYVGVIGSLLAGCTYVPLNTRFPAERNRAILDESGAAALVLDAQAAQEIGTLLGEPTGTVRVITADESAFPAVPLQDVEAVRVDPGLPCYLLFTSGTTGTPKGVPITHGNLGAYLPAIHQHVPIGPSDRVLQCVDLTFDLSVHDMFLTWLNGAQLFSMPQDGSIFAPRLIAQHQLTACLLVPSTAARALQEGLLGSNRMPTLRYSLFAGEALPVSIVEAWRDAAPNSALFNLYGPTEGTIHTSWYRVDARRPIDMPVVPIGWA